MKFRPFIFILCALLPGLAQAQNDGIPPIGTIEIYGHRTMTDEEVREALGFKEGDYSLPQLDMTVGPLLARKMGVQTVLVDGTCCDDNGEVLVFVGIDESGTHTLTFRPSSNGDVSLPAIIYDTFLAYNSAVRTASLSSNPTETLSEGHSLISDPRARVEQDKFLVFGAENLEILQSVLRDSRDRNHRATAAYVIGYAQDKTDVVEDLVDASLDPFNSVRSNATRSLGAIATLAAEHPELGIEIPVEPFIDMVNSVVYADRMMGIKVLLPLSAGRNEEVLAELSQSALPSLIEMSLWSYSRHSRAPYQILGRVMGLTEEEINQTINGDRQATIDRARN
jgi:hypothetical protein